MRIVSGIQPTGNLHLGNYLGAIRNWVRMQDEVAASGGQSLYFLADLHAIGQPHVPDELAANCREMVAALLACGIDPAKSVLFNQAQVPQHAELQWLLSGTARMGWLSRMTQFKDKAGKNREGQSVALFTYPVLQAADVLIYQATHVPVGDDQKQHLELARDIAQKFNNDFCTPETPVFTLPEPIIPPEARAARMVAIAMYASGDRAAVPRHDAQHVRHSAPARQPCEYQPPADERRQTEEAGRDEQAEQHPRQHQRASGDLHLPHDLQWLRSIGNGGLSRTAPRIDPARQDMGLGTVRSRHQLSRIVRRAHPGLAMEYYRAPVVRQITDPVERHVDRAGDTLARMFVGAANIDQASTGIERGSSVGRGEGRKRHRINPCNRAGRG